MVLIFDLSCNLYGKGFVKYLNFVTGYNDSWVWNLSWLWWWTKLMVYKVVNVAQNEIIYTK